MSYGLHRHSLYPPLQALVSLAKAGLQKQPSTEMGPAEAVKTHPSKKAAAKQDAQKNFLGEPVLNLSIRTSSKNNIAARVDTRQHPKMERTLSVAVKMGPSKTELPPKWSGPITSSYRHEP